MSKKKRLVVTKKDGNWISKYRWLLFPVLFGLGALGASYINANDLMNKVQSGSNQGLQITWIVQICTYLCVVGLIVLGYQFEAKLEKNESN